MAETRDDDDGPIVYNPPPPPPINTAAVLFVLVGVATIALTLFSDELRVPLLALGLIEILAGVWLGIAASRWRTRHHQWAAELGARGTPRSTAGGS